MKLESKISPQPNAAVRVTFSSKKKTPIKTPKIIREYLNGVIADTSPIRIAEMMALYPIVPNKIPIRRKSQELVSGKRIGSSLNKCSTMPESAIDKKPWSPRAKILSAFGTARLARSRLAKPSIPSTARIDRNEKLSLPGSTIITTPKKPKMTANHLIAVTLSLNKTAAPTTTTSGVACKIIVDDDSGVKASAEE